MTMAKWQPLMAFKERRDYRSQPFVITTFRDHGVISNVPNGQYYHERYLKNALTVFRY